MYLMVSISRTLLEPLSRFDDSVLTTGENSDGKVLSSESWIFESQPGEAIGNGPRLGNMKIKIVTPKADVTPILEL